ncbi:MAG: AMP-binding protein [Planctomycetes bacterium]|nr:AMP-binding protein [Planctomycetota bacterium]
MSEPKTLLDLLEASAKTRPSESAVLSADRTLTYAELQGGAQKLGVAFAAATNKPVIALFLPMTPAFVTAFYAGLYAGKAVLPLNMLLGGEDLAYILQDSGADTVVTIKLFAKKLEGLPAKILTLEEFPPPAAPKPAPRPQPDDLATLLYTSGTTGRPKGVELTHRNLCSNTVSDIQALDFKPEYRVLACLPTFHTFAITATMAVPIGAGGSLFCIPRFEPEACLKAASDARCNTLVMVPSMFRVLTKLQQRKPVPLDLKLAVAGGEPLPHDTAVQFEQVFGIPLLEGYGLTETSPVIAFNVPSKHKQGTVGLPIPGIEVKIVDPASVKDLATGEVGEIWTRGPHVMRGYRNKPEETSQVLTADGWFRTGDMGMLDAAGYLTITGRLREMIKVAGEMVFPAEVENALLKHPAVAEAGVLGERHERRGETVKAFVALHEGQQVTADELLAHCRKDLAPYKVPREIQFRPELPKGPTGKVMRRLLK